MVANFFFGVGSMLIFALVRAVCLMKWKSLMR
jgi:hypothetical protein